MAKPQVYWSLCLRPGCLSARCALGGLTVNCPTPNSTPPRASVGTCTLCVIYSLLTQLYTKLGPVTIRLWVVRGLLGRTPRYLGRCRTGATLLALSYGCDSLVAPVVLVLLPKVGISLHKLATRAASIQRIRRLRTKHERRYSSRKSAELP